MRSQSLSLVNTASLTISVGFQQPIDWLLCHSYQPEDGYGPTIAQQLKLEPFKVVVQSNGIKPEFGGVTSSPRPIIMMTLRLECQMNCCMSYHQLYESSSAV